MDFTVLRDVSVDAQNKKKRSSLEKPTGSLIENYVKETMKIVCYVFWC
jgi:hypothetical protein